MPRPYSQPSRCASSNGGDSQSSSGAGGWTSKWPYTSTVGAPAPFALAGISPRTSSRSPKGVTSASPPERLTSSASHSAARTTSSRCAGSALTDGIAMNSRSSSSQAASTPANFTQQKRDSPRAGAVPWCDELRRCADPAAATGHDSGGLRGLVAELGRIGQGAELLQALVLDLADSFSRDVERA